MYPNSINFVLVFFFLINAHFCSAFQEPIEAYTFNVPKLDELVLQGKKQANEEQFDLSIKTYQTLQQKCWDYGLDSIAIDLYEDIFDCSFMKMQGLEYNLAFIDSCKKLEKDPSILGIYYGALAHNYIFHEEMDSMKKYYDLACNIYSQQQRYLQQTNLNIKVAYEYSYLIQLPLALEYLQKAEKLVGQKLRPRNYYTPSIYNLQTSIYYSLQKYEKAIQSSLATIQYDKKSGIASDYMIAYEYNNIATLLENLKDYESALNYYQKALSLTLKTGTKEPNKIMYLLHNIGYLYKVKDNITQQKNASFKGLNFLLETDNMNLESQQDFINICHSLAYCYLTEEKTDSTLYYINQAAKVNNNIPYKKPGTYKLYSLYFLAQNDTKQAKKYAFKALNTALKTYNTKSLEVALSYDLLAYISYSIKNYTAAIKYEQKALENLSSNFSDEEGFSNPRFTKVLDKNTLLVLLNNKMKYLNILYNQNHPNLSLDDLYQTAKLATETIDHLNKGIKNKKSQRAWLTKKAIPSFEQAIQIALSIYKRTKNFQYLNEAFVLSERSKSMLMQGDFQNKEAAALGGVPDSLVFQEKALKKKIVEIEKTRLDAKLNDNFDRMESMDSLVFGYKHELIQLLHLFEFDYPKYYKLKYALKNTSIKDVQAILEPKTTLIEYFEGKKNLYVFSITKDGARVHTIKKSETYAADVANFRSTLVSLHATAKNPVNYYNKFIETSFDFYNTFLKKSLNASSKRLIIIPDGQLSYLPFEVFLNQEVLPEKNQAISNINYANLPYLLRDYNINYNYSATLLIEQLNRKKGVSNGNILAFAPDYKNKIAASWRNPDEQKLRKKLVELPGASKELISLKSTFNGSFWGDIGATESSFKKEMADYSILHFALHGFADTKNSDFSGLIFSEDQSKIEDNILYAYEIKQLDLNADFVVLSACETGVGLYQSGEGILSLGRDFMYAGVPSVLSTLWSLNDYSGSIIIKEFYANLNLGMDKDEAIRQAKLHYLDNHTGPPTHPSFWACFVQIGDYNSIPVHKSYKAWYIGLA
ncbi:MAG: CHAT domain-containing protein, partial [Aureispira sp.]|nr:CHAT domain-containing protein [Aureispira sp.]